MSKTALVPISPNTLKLILFKTSKMFPKSFTNVSAADL